MVITADEAIGPKIRHQRRKLGLTLDELSGRTSISKPYLSLIENNRVANPPSDEKLRRLEQTLGFASGELVDQAHLQRTPQDVRAMLMKLSGNGAARPSVSGLAPVFVSIPQAATEARSSITLLTQTVGWPDLKDKEAFAARIGDDGMTPEFRPGDVVIFSPAAPARDGDDCFVRLADGRAMFQRVFFESNDHGEQMVRLQPRNGRRRAMIVPADQIAAAYKAVFKYQRIEE
jgi:SOS-response transcriptional repressor LexA